MALTSQTLNRNLKVGLQSLWWVLCLSLWGCSPTYPKCGSDDHCKEHNEVCVQGECRECATDSHCKAGFVCDANKCVPKPECRDDGPCGPGRKCKAGKCTEASKEPGTCTVNGDCGVDEECKAGRCTSKSGAGKCDYAPIRFDFNEHKLSEAGRIALNTVAECMKSQGGKFTLEGHADERGTEEFNLQLSNRRAASVKRYLGDLGVQDNTLDTVGFGENRPAVPGGGEEAWSANRRVEIRKR